MTREGGFLLAALLGIASPLAAEGASDWLIDPSPYRAFVQGAPDGRSLCLANGLVRRTIRLDADVVHLRRPDRRDWDGLLHVDPRLPIRGLAMIHNPLDADVVRDIRLPLYYTGLTEAALVRGEDGPLRRIALDRDHSVTARVRLPARGRTFLTLEAP